MAEYEHRYEHTIRLIMESGEGSFIMTDSAASLLPFIFSGKALR
jgi:hypothetical protein